jgi:Kinetochore protein CHL4 like
MPPKKASSPSLRDTLPSSTLIPPSALLRRFLTRLPKSVLIDLVLIWLDHPLCPIHEPDDEEDQFMQDDETLDDKKAVYTEYRDDNAVAKGVVIDKILMNDWV